MFSKFKQILSLELQDLNEYKGDLFIYTFTPFILTLVLMVVWLSVLDFSSGNNAEKSYIVSYFFFQLIVARLVGAWHAPYLGEKIRQGDVSKYLLKPASFIWYDIAENIVEKIWKITFSLPLYIIIGYFLRRNLFISWENILPFLVSLIGAMIIYFLIEHLIGLSAFWLSETGAIDSYNEVFFFITSGKLFPLSYVTKLIPLGVINILPYKYMLGFPLDVLLGKTTGQTLWSDFGMQFVWVVGLILLYKVVWSKGLQKYGGYGG
ncbi:MAG: ABC-2 family transporter protein [bacterium]|nr:ABC-2 family transporter protein [bacterium]